MGGERGDWPSRVLTRGSETRDALVPTEAFSRSFSVLSILS